MSYTKRYAKAAAMVAAGLFATITEALAAVPVEVSASLTEAKTDSLVVAGLALVIVIAIAAFKYMKRAV